MMTDEDKILLSKQQITRQGLEEQIQLIRTQLEEIEIKIKENLQSSLAVTGKIYPNSKIYFGKYSYKGNHQFSSVEFRLDKSEININPL